LVCTIATGDSRMKKILVWVLAIIAVSCADMLPFTGTDVAKLHPIEVLIIERDNGIFSVSTDSGITGFGTDIPGALSDLKLTAPGEVFLDTANYVLLTSECMDVIGTLFVYIRPACQIYLFEGRGDWEKVSKYLESHPSEATLFTYGREGTQIPKLIVKEDEYRLVE